MTVRGGGGRGDGNNHVTRHILTQTNRRLFGGFGIIYGHIPGHARTNVLLHTGNHAIVVGGMDTRSQHCTNGADRPTCIPGSDEDNYDSVLTEAEHSAPFLS